MLGWRARVGVLVPPGNPTVEPELYRMAPNGVSMHFARFDPGHDTGEPGGAEGMEERTRALLAGLEAPGRALAAVKPAAVILAHTGVSYVNTFAGEEALVARLTAAAGAPATTAAGAISAALRHLGARRLALGTPYPEVIGALGRAYWEAAGFAIVSHRRLDGVANIYAESAGRAYQLARQADAAGADAVLLSGTGLPTIDVIEALERDLGKPVVSSVQASLWQALRLAGVHAPIPGFGRLLREV
jgi:maleate cis-trans isomerase